MSYDGKHKLSKSHSELWDSLIFVVVDNEYVPELFQDDELMSVRIVQFKH